MYVTFDGVGVFLDSSGLLMYKLSNIRNFGKSLIRFYLILMNHVIWSRNIGSIHNIPRYQNIS